MHRHALVLSAMLALAVPCAASATQGPVATTAVPAHVIAPIAVHQAGPADTRVAIILQRKPAKKSGK